MLRPPPRSTRTDTLFPYTTLFRSSWGTMEDSEREDRHRDWRLPPDSKDETYGDRLVRISRMGGEFLEKSGMAEEIRLRAKLMDGGTPQEMRRARAERSEERRVGKECVGTCRSRGAP